jgi:predicted transcriptional regulator of viral defense system
MNTKSSLTLRFLESHEVFTLDEFMAAVDPGVSVRTREANLRNAIKRDQAFRICRGLYASNLGVFRDRVPNTMLIAAKAAPDAVVAYHSALEVHGVAHTPARTVYFLSGKKVSPFSVRGYRFRRAPAPDDRREQPTERALITDVRAGGALVPTTSRERTLVDCLSRLDLAGGLEELLRSVGTFTTMSSADVARYAGSLGSPTLVARAGWLLSLMQREWLFDTAPLEEMRRSLGRGTYWLQRRRPEVDYDFVSEWRLYVPAGLPYRDWLRG